jgi:hypothetical protein
MEICPEPFLGYKATEFYSKKEGRCYIILRKEGKRPTSMSRARYKMCIKEKRKLNKNEHVDHIDNNPKNDDINNLQILTLAENNKKYRKFAKIKKAMVKMICPCCKKIFIKEKHQSFLSKKNKRFDSCSRRCGGKLAHLTAIGIKFDISDNFIEEFEIDSK